MNYYRFEELSETAKNRAIKEYSDGLVILNQREKSKDKVYIVDSLIKYYGKNFESTGNFVNPINQKKE